MPLFAYKAVDGGGKTVQGSVNAASKGAALDHLTSLGVFATDVSEQRVASADKGSSGNFRLPFMPKVSANELVLFIRRLSTLVDADIPLIKCLDTLSERIESATFRVVVDDVKENVRHGLSFSQALAKHTDVFPELMISMVKVGETGGILGTVLEQLADFAEHDREVRSEVRMAMAYPAFIIVFALLIVVFLMVTVVPKLTALFEDMQGSLPLPTLVLITVSGFIKGNFWTLLGAFTLVVGGIVWFARTPQGRSVYDSVKLSIPLFGPLSAKTSIARFSRSLGALASGGVPLMEALDVVKDIMDNERMTQSVERMKDALRRGESIADGMSREALFPAMVSSMVAAGEESARLDAMLFKIADVYEMETRNAVKVVVGLLGPLMILMVAGIVVFIALAMLLPVFQINQLIG
jgi:type II secretory pathway component PulF